MLDESLDARLREVAILELVEGYGEGLEVHLLGQISKDPTRTSTYKHDVGKTSEMSCKIRGYVFASS